MKKALIPVIATAALIASALVSGCGGGASGDEITEEKDFTDFTSVDVGSAFEVDISQADSFSVIITADESLFEYVEVSKSGRTLKIYLNPLAIFYSK